MKIVPQTILAAGLAAILATPAAAGEDVVLFAAGSLKAALSDVATAYARQGGAAVKATWGPSGLLKQRLEGGEPADLFTSANMEHPKSLEDKGLAEPVQRFARNKLCVLAQPNMTVTAETLLERLLDPAVRVGTSTPKADPAGDYAWQMFERAEKLRPGSLAILDAKALKLAGGPDSPKPPADRTIYGVLMEQGKSDVFVTYCTNAVLAVREVPSLKVVQVPPELSVAADYGLTVLKGKANGPAADFARFILAPTGQAILERHGFSGS